MTFSRFLIILFQNILFSKEFLASNCCFGLFIKIKKGSGTCFLCTFSAWFWHKNVLYSILYQWTKFRCHTFFPSQDIKHIVLLSSYLDSWHDVINFTIYLQTTSNTMGDREIKRGRWKYKKLNISRTKRAFWMKKNFFFIVFEGLSFGWKQKFDKK